MREPPTHDRDYPYDGVRSVEAADGDVGGSSSNAIICEAIESRSIVSCFARARDPQGHPLINAWDATTSSLPAQIIN